MPSVVGRGKVALDMTDLNGLRGVAAVWIMLFHCFAYSDLHWNIQGSTLMPLFFLLSGFSLSVGYMFRFGTQGAGSAAQVSPAPPAVQELSSVVYTSLAHEDQGHMGDVETSELNTNRTQTREAAILPDAKKPSRLSPTGQYFYNRIIRVMPVFYITFALALPLTLQGYGSFDPRGQFTLIASIIQNIIPTYTWTFFLLGVDIDGPGWTVCTLWFFWLLFPWMQRYYEKQTDAELLHTIVRCFLIQLSIGMVVLPITILFTGSVAAGFWWATGVPYSRLPVFIMGMCGGILSSRYAESDSMPWFTESSAFIPLGFWCFWFCPGITCCSPENTCCNGRSLTSTTVDFKRTCMHQAVQLLMFTVLWSVVCTAVSDVGSNWWFQLQNAFAQLDLLVALTRAKGTTLCSTVLRAPAVQWLGELSMSIYLVHFPLIFYLCWILHGSSVHWPPSMDCSTYGEEGSPEQLDCYRQYDTWRDARVLPAWGIAVVPPVALLAAACLYYGVEEPVRKYFK